MQQAATIGRDAIASGRVRASIRVVARRVLQLTVLVALLGGLVVGGSSVPVGAVGGGMDGPIAGRFWASFGAKVGQGGSVVAYTTTVRNFDPSVSPALLSVYLRDGSANIPVVRPMVAGSLPDGISVALGVSPEVGTRYVLYRSAASNLVPGDTKGKQDLFLFDRVANTTERVSVGVNGEGNGDTLLGAMSGNTAANGQAPRYVTFVSSSSNLVAGDGNGKADVFVRDRTNGATSLVSRGVGNTAANGDSLQAVVSDNGRFVAFSSLASNLVAGDGNGSSDVFVTDRVANTTERVSVGFVGEGTGSATAPQISADGRFVAFDSGADDLVPDDDNFGYDVFVRDRLNGSIERVSVGTDGQQGEDDSASPSMSRDGRFIAFETGAEEFSTNDGNISIDIYMRDRLTRTTQRASEKSNDLDAFADSTGASISPDGRYVGFETDSGDFFETQDLNDDYDVYVKDMGTAFFNNTTFGSRFTGITPKRLLDTAAGPVPTGFVAGTKLIGGATLNVQATGGTTTVPTTAKAVLLNVSTTGETTAGAELTVFAAGSTRPKVVSVHPQVGAPVSNQVIAKVGAGGAVSLYTNKGAAHVTVDVVGYYATDVGDAYTALDVPTVVDTRTTLVPTGWPARQPLQAGGAYGRLDLKVTELSSVPTTARAVALYVTALTPPAGGTKLTAFPAGAPNPGTANVYPQVGTYVTNLAVVPVGIDGKVSLAIDTGSVHVMVALAGYYEPSGDALFFPLTPARVLDTRSTNLTLAVPGHTGPLLPIQSMSFSPLGRGGVPSNARTLALTMSSADATANPSVLMTWPTGTPMNTASHLNSRVGTNVSNTLLSGLGTGGGLSMLNYSLTSVNLFADVYGYYR